LASVQSGWKTGICPDLPEGLSESAVCVSGGGVYLCAGCRFAGEQQEPVKDFYRWEPGSESWMQLEAMIHPHRSPQVCFDENKVWVLGGQSQNHVETYDPQSNKWLDQDMLCQRGQTGAVFMNCFNEAFILVPGGRREDGLADILIYVYDRSHERWECDTCITKLETAVYDCSVELTKIRRNDWHSKKHRNQEVSTTHH